MLKTAVWTGIRTGHLLPHCLYFGVRDTPMYSWLIQMGVTIFHHNPSWADVIVNNSLNNIEENKKSSHLFYDRAGIIGTWQRIDMPLLPIPYDYVLFTDSDVIFLKRVLLNDFHYPLPSCLGMGWEMNDYPPYNAGVLLVYLPCLRNSYQNFLDFILKSTNGFANYGPGDQGAINQFYKSNITHIPKIWNAKPYHFFLSDAVIVHFHGPKPHHLFEFEKTRSCPYNFGSLCKEALRNAGPVYLDLYRFAQGEIASFEQGASITGKLEISSQWRHSTKPLCYDLDKTNALRAPYSVLSATSAENCCRLCAAQWPRCRAWAWVPLPAMLRVKEPSRLSKNCELGSTPLISIH